MLTYYISILKHVFIFHYLNTIKQYENEKKIQKNVTPTC